MSAVRDSSAILEENEPLALPASGTTVAVRPLASREHDEVFLHIDLLRSLSQHRWLAIAIACTGLALALAYVLKVGPVYSAQSQVYIQPAPPRLMQTSTAPVWPSDANTYESYIQQQMQNMTRSDVLVAALKKLPPATWRTPRETEQEAAERLGRSIEITRLGSSYMVSVASHAHSPALAAQISNALASSFIEIESRELRAGDPQRIELLREERDRILKALAEDRAEQEDLNKQLGVADVGPAPPNPYDEQIKEIRAELVKARAANDEAAAKLTAVTGGASASSTALDAEADELVAADPGLVSMKTSLNARRAVLITQMANLTPNHPQYKQDADELAQINGSLNSMMQDLRGKVSHIIAQRLKNDLERTSMVEARLNAHLGQLTGAAGGATPRLQRSNELATDILRLQNRFTAVDEQFRNLTMENQAPGAAYVSSAAVPPLHVSSYPVLRKAMLLLFVSLLLAVVAAVAAQNLDSRIYIAEDVERVLGFSPMAQLPDFRQVSSGVGEEYMLRLAGAIEHAYQQRGLKSCIFTGVAPGAGVTTVITRVRTMLEGIGRSTVMVDASGTPPPPAATGDRTESTNLVMAEKELRPSALLQQMAEEMDADTIVLTDTAPLLASGETEYLARFVDSAIVVIQSGLTTRAQLREVAQTLQRLEVAAVGFVLNRIAAQKASPSFRQSIRVVEQRLRIQNRSHARRPARSGPPSPPEPESAQEPYVVKQPDPVKPSVAVPAPDPSPQPAAPARPVTSTPPARAAYRAAAVDTAPASTPRPARGRGEPARTAPSPQAPARPAPEPAVAEKSVPPPPVAEAAQAPAAVVEPAPAPPVVRPVAAAPAAVPVTPPAPSIPPSHPAVNLAALPSDVEPESDYPEYSTASRLGGLRNLLVSLGRRSLTKEFDHQPHESELEPRFERATVRPAYAASPASSAQSELEESGSVAMRVVAQPEFLPPKPIAEVEKEKEKETARAAAPPARWEPGDEPETLPSVRGQYRKKRYPQM
ncbi:MAG TPA: hypothetical protein VGG85_17725 [Terracidiphilus sp.]|jgi:uncharacterized protein involved in exopolysaccharide biosynthesis